MRLVTVSNRLAGTWLLVCALLLAAQTVAAARSPKRGAQNPFTGQQLYVDPGSDPAQTQQMWASQGRIADAAMIGKIASRPQAVWFSDSGGTAGAVDRLVSKAAAAGAMPVLVAYGLSDRDCRSFSSGGTATAYRAFIDGMAQGIGGRRAAVILEPDALAQLSCRSASGQNGFYSLLRYAVGRLSSAPRISVYLDAGHARWRPTATMAARLRRAGVARARGFAINVSGFDWTRSEIAYGTSIVRHLRTVKHFVIDTSRNGRGPARNAEWCNPPGRGLGPVPTATTGSPLVDAFLWIKRPGESDGQCNGGPSAGSWWPDYALGLARNAVF